MRLNRRKLKFFRRKYSKMLTFIILLLLVAIGYAGLSTTLSIDGTSTVSRTVWDVHFDNIQVKTGSVTPTTAPSISNNTTVSFSLTLEEPEDFYEFDIDVVNNGTLDAMIDSITVTPILNDDQINYFNYVVAYSDGTALAEKHKLDAGDTETLTISFEYLENDDVSLYPIEDQNLTFSCSIDFVQKDNTAIEVPHPAAGNTVYTANFSTDGSITIGSPIPNGITTYTSAAAAMSALENETGYSTPYALMHVIDNGNVIESYVVFTVTPAMASSNPGMTAGTYTLKGMDTSQYSNNVSVMQSAFGTSYCTDNTTNYFCTITGLVVKANANNGRVEAYDGNVGCNVRSNNAVCDYMGGI